MAAEATGEVYYGTQILASSKKMSLTDPFFKKNKVEMLSTGKIYKYLTGCSSDLSEAKKTFSTIRVSYPDAFLVKVENGQATRVK